MNESLEKIVSQIENNKIKGALDNLILYTSDNLFVDEFKNAILLKSRFKDFLHKEQLGITTTTTEINKIRSSILDITFELKGKHRPNSCNHLNVVSPLNQNEKIIGIFGEVFQTLEQSRKINFDEKTNLYSKFSESAGLLTELVHDEIGKDLPRILFNKTISTSKLKQIDLEKLNNFPFSNKYSGLEKALIISGITINLINNFSSKLFDILITFLLTLESDIWEHALASLVVVAKEHTHKILLYPEIVTRLEKLREIKIFQEGINRIETDQIELHSAKPIFCNQKDLDNYLNEPFYWFLKFDLTNEIIKSEIENIPEIEDIHLLLEQLEDDRHLITPEKYWIVKNLSSFSDDEIEKLFVFLENSVNCDEDHTFDYFIRDYYSYISFKKPTYKIKSKTNTSLYEGNLKSIISKDYYAYKYLAYRANKSGQIEESIDYYKKAIDEDRWDSPCNFCWSVSQLQEVGDIESADKLSSLAYDIFNQAHFLSLQIEYKILLQNETKVDDLQIIYLKNHSTLKDIASLANTYLKYKKYNLALNLYESFIDNTTDKDSNYFINKELIKVSLVLDKTNLAKSHLNNLLVNEEDYELKVFNFLLFSTDLNIQQFLKPYFENQNISEIELNNTVSLIRGLVDAYQEQNQSDKYSTIINFFENIKTEQNQA